MTLVEVIVAVFTISLLCVFLILAASRPSRCRVSAKRSACLSNVRQIGLAFKQYAVDNNDEFPSMKLARGPIGSSSVYLFLTNGNYLAPGRIYVCPSDQSRVPGTATGFTGANNSYVCVVSNRLGSAGLTEAASSDNPLILDRGLGGSPGYVWQLSTNRWVKSPHALTDGGNILYVGGQAAFKKFFDCGTDGTNGYVLNP